MKKLVLFFAVIVAVSFASCGKKAAPADVVATDSTTVTTTVDTTTTVAAVDTTVTAAPVAE